MFHLQGLWRDSFAPIMARMATTSTSVLTTTARRAKGTKLPTYVFESGYHLENHVARLVAGVIRERNTLGQSAVLGLPSGSTPVGVYRELIRMHREEALDFSNVVTFNLDEYFGLAPDQLQSYHRWMRETFFQHINIPPENTNLPHGSVPLDEIDDHCRDYEVAIERAGGIDVMLLGIGRNGHIGFNEPLSSPRGRTRLVTLDATTRRAAASDFFGEENVPAHAITMGMSVRFLPLAKSCYWHLANTKPQSFARQSKNRYRNVFPQVTCKNTQMQPALSTKLPVRIWLIAILRGYSAMSSGPMHL